jgi:hypothetical protein
MSDFLFEIHGEPTVAQHEAEQRAIEAREGERRKREGQQRAAMSKDTLLGYARGLAVDLARENGGLCHADMVAEALTKEGKPLLGDAAGSLWLKHVWEFSGTFHFSTRPGQHRNRLMIWRLRHA